MILEETVAIIAFYTGVQYSNYASSFHRKSTATLVKLSERVRQYIDTKEFIKTKATGLDDDGAIVKRKHEGPSRGPRKKQKPN